MRLRKLIFPFLACALNGYFGYHLLHGKHGLETRATQEQRAAVLQAKLTALREIKAELKRDVALLHPDHIDPDMLDERARALLDLAHPDDFVVRQKKSRPSER